MESAILMEYQFNAADLLRQHRSNARFDSDGLLNPGKVFPRLHRCAEGGRMHVHRGEMKFPELPRFRWICGGRTRAANSAVSLSVVG